MTITVDRLMDPEIWWLSMNLFAVAQAVVFAIYEWRVRHLLRRDHWSAQERVQVLMLLSLGASLIATTWLAMQLTVVVG